MTDLQRALYQFAQENRVYPLLHPEQQELRDNQAMFQAARERLCALGAEEADLAERMEDGLLRCSSIEQEAVFLAGGPRASPTQNQNRHVLSYLS